MSKYRIVVQGGKTVHTVKLGDRWKQSGRKYRNKEEENEGKQIKAKKKMRIRNKKRSGERGGRNKAEK